MKRATEEILSQSGDRAGAAPPAEAYTVREVATGQTIGGLPADPVDQAKEDARFWQTYRDLSDEGRAAIRYAVQVIRDAQDTIAAGGVIDLEEIRASAHPYIADDLAGHVARLMAEGGTDHAGN